ncbi:MAG: helix-hairpin-helix domain-containing protein [Desulfocapsa sp.]|nr:helix-hairpin-helix domain-containing protein [Desulfocapsa sp.]
MFLTINVALAAININTADEKELATLQGVGKAKATAIVQYRKENFPGFAVSHRISFCNHIP